MKEANEHIYSLTERFFHAELSSDEEKELLAWVEENEENRRFFLEQKKLILALKARTEPIDSKAAFAKVEKQIHPRKPRIRKLYIGIASVAATVLLAFGLWHFFTQNPALPVETVYASLQTQKSDTETTLPDGSVISINKNSKLDVMSFENSTTRQLYLHRGNAFFEVSPDSAKPFIVTVGIFDITVLGTAFDVKTDSSNTSVTVSVQHGKVKVRNKKSNEFVILSANQACIANINNGFSTYTLHNRNYLAWKTGVLEFENTPLQEAVKDLQPFCGKEFVFADEELRTLPITAKIYDSTINDLSNLLNAVFAIEVIETDSVIYLKKE